MHRLKIDIYRGPGRSDLICIRMPANCAGMRSLHGGHGVKIAIFWIFFFVAALADPLMLAVLLFRAINVHIGAPVMIERISKVIPLCLAAVSALVIRIAPFRAGGGGSS